jgi:hypothetical protein
VEVSSLPTFRAHWFLLLDSDWSTYSNLTSNVHPPPAVSSLQVLIWQSASRPASTEALGWAQRRTCVSSLLELAMPHVLWSSCPQWPYRGRLLERLMHQQDGRRLPKPVYFV